MTAPCAPLEQLKVLLNDEAAEALGVQKGIAIQLTVRLQAQQELRLALVRVLS